MKKILAVLLCVLLLGAGFYACKKEEPSPLPDPSQSEESSLPEEPEAESPSGVAVRFLNGVIALDEEEIRAVITNPDANQWVDGLTKSNSGEEAYMELIRTYLKKTSYRLGDATIDGDTAFVEVTFLVPDIATAINDMVTEIIKQAAMAALKGEKPDYEAMAAEYMEKNVDIDSLPKTEAESEITLLRQSDGSWLVDAGSDKGKDLLNDLSGGIMEKLESFEAQLAR